MFVTKPVIIVKVSRGRYYAVNELIQYHMCMFTNSRVYNVQQIVNGVNTRKMEMVR